jgi:hypothetical protein
LPLMTPLSSFATRATTKFTPSTGRRLS